MTTNDRPGSPTTRLGRPRNGGSDTETEDSSSAEEGSVTETREADRPEFPGVTTDTTQQSVATRSTGRWRGIVAVVLLAAAAGVIAKRPALLFVAAVGVAFAAYPLITAAPEPALSVSRQITPEPATDGDLIDIQTTVRNDGEETLFDLRLVDGIPPMLSLVGGSARAATTLRPDETITLNYALRARPGRHQFQPTTAICRDASGSIEVETHVAASDEIECATHLPSVPLRAQSRHRTGPLVTDESGSGLEFHSVTEYERGDPANRIDWRQFARSGELTTVTFRPERLADVIVCVDARPEAYRASDPSEPHAVAHAVDAAGRIGEVLFESNHRVGLAAFGRTSSLLPPGTGRVHSARYRQRLAADPAVSLVPPESTRTTRALPSTGVELETEGESREKQLSSIRAELGANTQLLLVTPLCDDEATQIAQRFEADGASVTVISPDVTTADSPGGQLARVERSHRLSALRNAGIPTIDWDTTTPLGTALANAERWDR